MPGHFSGKVYYFAEKVVQKNVLEIVSYELDGCAPACAFVMGSGCANVSCKPAAIDQYMLYNFVQFDHPLSHPIFFQH